MRLLLDTPVAEGEELGEMEMGREAVGEGGVVILEWDLDSIEGDKRSSHHVGTNITMTFWEKRISLQLLWFTTAFYQAMFTLTEAIYTSLVPKLSTSYPD